MKYIFILFSVALFAKGCGETSSEKATTNSAQDDITISYEASSRGFYQKINVTKNLFSLKTVRDGKVSVEQEMTTADWNEIVKLLDKIDSEKKDETTGTDEDIARDAAIPAKLTVKYKESTITSKTFAHGNPPADLAPLVAKIQAMAIAVDKP